MKTSKSILPASPVSTNCSFQGKFLQFYITAAVGKKLANMTNLHEKLRPDALQKYADNLTGVVTPTMSDVDLKKMMGRWFESLNSPRSTAQRCIVHHFGGLTQNDKTATFTALKIYREGTDFGQVRYSIGYAFQSGNKPGMLQIHSSESEDPVPFWIFKVGNVTKDTLGNDQYEYAIVSNWVRYPVTVLVRDPDRYKKQYEEEVMKWLEANKFINLLSKTFNLLQATEYTNCQYPESAFQMFG
ncbi:unnamed protein product [Soboliphyme baturini]|uniref:Lipocln_cytosolic_FA-bd_dom domain-containing protein n=1 Tax=Soboliphyme baturini TaxID=241478 RepID=A0A183IK78_9BILA|nr:unnamed protein product [Soboliphyme baturini]